MPDQSQRISHRLTAWASIVVAAAAVCGMVYSGGVMGEQARHCTETIGALQVRVLSVENRQTAIEGDIREIKSDVKWLARDRDQKGKP